MRVSVRTEPVNQAFVAAITLPVLEQGLALRSDWTDARPVDRRWVLEGLAPGTEVAATVAGRRLTATVDEHGTAALVWDGLDASGARAGPSVATAEIDGETRRMKLGRWDARAVGLGGLLLGGYDHLDAVSRRVHLGNGRTRTGIAIQATEGGWRVPRARGRQLADFDGDGFLTRVTETASGRVLVACERTDGALRSFARTRGALTAAPTADGLELEAANRRVRVTVDDDGRIVQLRGPDEDDLTVAWDAGLLTAITDADGFAHRFEYDDTGRLVAFTRPGRGPTRLVRTATEHGRRVLVLTAEGRESSYQVEVLPDGTRVRTTRCCGRPPRVTRIDGASLEVEVGDGTRIHTDRSTGRRRVVLPSGLARERTRSGNGVAVNGRTWQWTTDPAATTSTSPEGRVKGIWVRDGEVTMVRKGQRTTLQRDEHGRVSQVTQGRLQWQVGYDDSGLVTRVVSSDGAETTMDHDPGGWLVGQRLPGDRHLAIDRSTGGRVIGLTVPGGGTTSMTLAAPDLLESVRFPDAEGHGGGAVRYQRDADGMVVGYQEGTAPAVSLVRDASGLVTETRVGDEAVTSLEYEHGRPVRATTRDGQVTSITWDGPLLTSIAQEGVVAGAVHRRHDADLQVDAVACRQLNAAVRRDRDGLITGLGPATLERDGEGRVVAIRAGVVAQTWEHDEHGHVTATQVQVRGQTGWRVDYARDQRGRLTTLTDSRVADGQPSQFTYDEAGRLISATGPFPFSATWDDNANPVSWQSGEASHAGSIADDDRLLAIDGEPVAHDGAGRVQSVPGTGLRLGRDPRGRLATIENAAEDGTAATTRLTRDATGAVVQLVTDGHEPLRLLPGPYGHPEAVVAADGTPQMLLVGGTQVDPPVIAVEADRTLLLACDHVGTVRLVIDITTGELVDERVHDHWGRLERRAGHSAVPFGWGCGLLDTATGLVHFPARSYSPDLLRFLARDPRLFRGRSTNLYGFAEGDPVNHGDPTGTTRLCRSGFYRWQVPDTDIKETWEHWWIEDKNGNEAGWGTGTDSVYNDNSSFGEFGEVKDHGDRSEADGSECDEVEDVDDECVARELQQRMGDELGFWGPGNTCQNWVDEVLSNCSDGDYTVVTDNPDAYDNVYGPSPDTRPTGGDADADAGGGYTPADGQYTPADGGSLWE